MPPNTETGELDKDLGLTPATTPIAEPAIPDASVPPEENAQQPSSEQDNAAKDEGPKTMAEAIADALQPEAASEDDTGEKGADKNVAPPADKVPDPAAEANADKSTQPAEEDGEADEDPSEDELKTYSPKSQKRVKQLLSQRNTFRREADDLREDAEHYRNIRSFMSDSRLEDGEVAELFKVGKLLKGTDPAGFEAALDIVLPIAEQLLELTGRSLPKELREQVENGALTEEHAREQARLRTRAIMAERERDEVRTTATTQQSQQSRIAHQTAVNTAVGAWEARVRQSDPDFGLKADAMRDAALALVAEKGAPKTAEEAVQFAQATYDKVNSWFSKARPAAQPSRPAPRSGSNGNRAGLAPAPKTLEEAIKGALSAKAAT
ncbi:MAG: hypothetical protein J0I48_13860 [Devosia sp.]|uniref:hypothetical protein n=1 Tax=Devosia sp. 66-22 TaxID=1895753 RepID=UPI0009292399|nr:hypothetical protein [Devosia sp. 66-22]MBN9347264.1 hypothetical protein [Devosia sp.]OJX49008.1 MAG: hypothetical protein BGO81_10460 [Devosia sp. 66-22]